MKRDIQKIIIPKNKFQLILIFISLFVFSCSTEKNRFINRAYHSVNTKYNGYFNARESYNNGLNSLENAHLDNYEEVLEIFKYGSIQSRASVASNMDIAYEKCSRVIRKHSMNIKGTEYNKFIDDAYFLIARSHYFKDDHNLAIVMFEYIIRQYDTPLKYESKIWIAKSRHQLEQFAMADQLLNLVQKDYEEGLLSKNAIRLYNLVRADHFIKQDKYKESIPFLTEGINYTKNRKEKTRLTFVLGQVYYKSGNYFEAQKSYAEVLKMNPDFDMAFRARINMAMSFDPKSGNLKTIKEDLRKMLKAERNKDFRDEIYYAMGMLELRQDNTAKAIEYFLESTKVSEKNKFQKGLSFLKLGELHFEMPEYLKASIYYDSVVAFVPTDYSEFEKIKNRQKVLFSLAKHLRVIEHEDSLQRLASMTPAERNKIVDELIRDLREKESIEREMEMERMRQMQQMAGREATNRASSRSAEGGASWYFYNTSTINFGKTEFYAKWGNRELEDLWRISNKQVIAFGEDMEEIDVEAEAEKASEKYNRQSYLDNIPLTSEQLELSNKLLAEAYFNIGLILKNDIKDQDNAMKSFNTLINRFSEFDKKLNAYYYMYSINNEIGNKAEADVFKDRIIREFPESDYAKILKDPNYAENIRKRKNASEILYNESYNAFLAGNFDVVIESYNKLDTVDTDDNLKAKFIFLKAVSYGKKEQTQEMKTNLEKIVENYKETNSFVAAQNLLNLISQMSDIAEKDDAVSEIKEEITSLYNYSPQSIHFFAIVINSKNIQLREVRNVLNGFNRENFKDNNLTISNIFLNDKQQLLTITNFQSADIAMDYYGKLVENKILDSYDIADYEAFLISVENYPIFYQDKNLEEYLKFYRYYYFQ